jgi:hypothetical protein
LSAIEERALAGFELVPRLFFGIGRQRPDANRRDRFRIIFAWPVIRAVKIECLLDTGSFAEKICERVGQAKISGKLSAVVRAAEYP